MKTINFINVDPLSRRPLYLSPARAITSARPGRRCGRTPAIPWTGMPDMSEGDGRLQRRGYPLVLDSSVVEARPVARVVPPVGFEPTLSEV